jgi:hypothetical protein
MYPPENIFRFAIIANGSKATKKPSILSEHKHFSYSRSTSNHNVLFPTPQVMSEHSLLLVPNLLM